LARSINTVSTYCGEAEWDLEDVRHELGAQQLGSVWLHLNGFDCPSTP